MVHRIDVALLSVLQGVVAVYQIDTVAVGTGEIACHDSTIRPVRKEDIGRESVLSKKISRPHGPCTCIHQPNT